MKKLNTILMTGIVSGAFAFGYFAKEYTDKRYDCVYSRNIQIADAEGIVALRDGRNARAKQTSINYVVSGKCDFDFNKLGDGEE